MGRHQAPSPFPFPIYFREREGERERTTHFYRVTADVLVLSGWAANSARVGRRGGVS
jgi:hypothetical protein